MNKTLVAAEVAAAMALQMGLAEWLATATEHATAIEDEDPVLEPGPCPLPASAQTQQAGRTASR